MIAVVLCVSDDCAWLIAGDLLHMIFFPASNVIATITSPLQTATLNGATSKTAGMAV